MLVYTNTTAYTVRRRLHKAGLKCKYANGLVRLKTGLLCCLLMSLDPRYTHQMIPRRHGKRLVIVLLKPASPKSAIWWRRCNYVSEHFINCTDSGRDTNCRPLYTFNSVYKINVMLFATFVLISWIDYLLLSTYVFNNLIVLMIVLTLFYNHLIGNNRKVVNSNCTFIYVRVC